MAVSAKEVALDQPSALSAAISAAQPGDVFVLPAGEFADVTMSFTAKGSPDKPITVRAKVPGKTIFTGESHLKFSGQHLVVEGLAFRDPGPKSSDVIEFRTDADEVATHCTLRDCAVTADPSAQGGHKESKWCSIYGNDNLLERCAFIGKANGGTTVVAWLKDDSTGRHTIRDCYFGPRPKLGKNGGETIRLGDSKTAHLSAKCLVTGNLFHQCNGEGEIISTKSCDNRYIGNTFLECQGALTTRHGHRSEIRKNLFLGNKQPLTGGVRIIGEDQVVAENVFSGLQGDEIRSAICFMNAIPDTPANGYQQVKRAIVENNIMVDCKVPFTIGMKHDKKCTLPPVDVTIRGNTVHSPKRPLIILMSEAPGWKWENNTFTAASVGAELPGVQLTDSPAPSLKLKPLSPSTTGPSWMR